MQKECRSRVSTGGPLDVTDNYATNGYRLRCRYIIHAVGPRWKAYTEEERCEEDLHRTITKCLQAAHTLHLKSIAIPAISAGKNHISRLFIYIIT